MGSLAWAHEDCPLRPTRRPGDVDRAWIEVVGDLGDAVDFPGDREFRVALRASKPLGDPTNEIHWSPRSPEEPGRDTGAPGQPIRTPMAVDRRWVSELQSSIMTEEER